MNPETTLTNEDIKNICEKHGIKFNHTKRITDGFTNEVHIVNDDVVLKVCTRADNIDRIKIETKILQHEDTIAKPTFIADDFSCTVIPAPYILMSYVEGQSLGAIWHTLNDQSREQIIKDVADNLRKFNNLPMANLFDEPVIWGDSLVVSFNKSSKELLTKNILTREQVDVTAEILNRYCSELNKTPTQVVFWDIHFDNFIVKDNRLAAIIDLEAVDQTALDYPLFVIQKQMQDPIKFLSLENEKYADKADYVHLWEWYEKYYPEMFEAGKLETRVNIYRLLDVVHLLKDWSHIKELYKQFDSYISKLN